MDRLTELEAINRMLLGIRLAPLASIDELDTYSEGMIARGILRQETLRVRTPGWNYNTRRMSLNPLEDGTIPVPAMTIDVFTAQGSPSYIVDYDDKLMATADGNKKFAAPVDIFVVLGSQWEALPPPIQLLCLDKARLAFKVEMRSSAGASDQVLNETIVRSEAAARAWDLRQKRKSMLDTLQMATHVRPNVPRYL
jgi:hypothetical protein